MSEQYAQKGMELVPTKVPLNLHSAPIGAGQVIVGDTMPYRPGIGVDILFPDRVISPAPGDLYNNSQDGWRIGTWLRSTSDVKILAENMPDSVRSVDIGGAINWCALRTENQNGLSYSKSMDWLKLQTAQTIGVIVSKLSAKDTESNDHKELLNKLDDTILDCTPFWGNEWLLKAIDKNKWATVSRARYFVKTVVG